jgi:hypothetical protein
VSNTTDIPEFLLSSRLSKQEKVLTKGSATFWGWSLRLLLLKLKTFVVFHFKIASLEERKTTKV